MDNRDELLKKIATALESIQMSIGKRSSVTQVHSSIESLEYIANSLNMIAVSLEKIHKAILLLNNNYVTISDRNTPK